MNQNSILYEDNHLIAINKKSSEIVQGDRTGDTTMPDTIKAYLKDKYNKPGNVFCGVIHRLVFLDPDDKESYDSDCDDVDENILQKNGWSMDDTIYGMDTACELQEL